MVLATLKRSESELSSFQRKVFKVDDHMGIAISGLTADGRVLCKYMRNECLNHRRVAHGAPGPAMRLSLPLCLYLSPSHQLSPRNLAVFGSAHTGTHLEIIYPIAGTSTSLRFPLGDW